MQKQALTKSDIVGQRIISFKYKPQDINHTINTYYIELENKNIFEIQSQDPYEKAQPINSIDRNFYATDTLKVDKDFVSGKKILDILISDLWPCIGILLYSKKWFLMQKREVVFIDALPPFENLVACFSDISKFKDDEIQSYWD